MTRPGPKASLFFGLFTAYAGMMAANPVFPPLARTLGLTELEVGALISITAIVFAACGPFWGAQSERRGRKPIFVLGLAGFGIGFALFTLVAQLGLSGAASGWALLGLFLAARIVMGVLLAAAPVSAQAYMADITETGERTAGMALIGAANGLGTVLGPAAAALLVTFGLLVPFYVGTIFVLVAALIIAWVMPDSPRAQSPAAHPRLRPWDPRLWPFLFVGFITVTVIVLLQVTLGFYLIDRFGLTPVAAAQASGVGLFVVGIALVIVQGVFVTRFKWMPRTLLRAGMPIMAVGLLGLLLAPSLPAVVAAFGVMGIAGGLLFPGFISGASLAVTADEQGAVAGLSAAANGAGAVIGPLLGTGLYKLDIAAPYAVSAALFAGLTLFVWLHPRVRERGA